MNNDQVLAKLKEAIKELEKRHAELVRLRKKPGGPLAERMDRQMQVLSRLSSLNARLLHVNMRENERMLAKNLGNAVPPLSATRKNKLTKALQKVSKRIADANTFKAAIKLASDISTAADRASDATRI